MKFKGLILMSLILLAFLAINVQAIEDAGSVKVKEGQSLADLLIEGSNAKEEYVNPVGAPATPQQARELQKNKSTLNWTMPSTLSAGGESAKESRDQAESTGETQTDAAAEETAAPAMQTSAAPTETVNVTGNWFFTLNESMTRELAMTLLQNDGNVRGSGRIREDNSSMDVAVCGTAAGSDLKLNLVSTNPIIEYKLNLTVDQDLASGDYQATSASGESWTGKAEGQKTS